MVDRRPRLIVRCASVGDVVTAVRTARELDLEIGVRCGGHSAAGLAVPDGGLMIDLTPMGARAGRPGTAPGVGAGRRAARRAGPRGPAVRPRHHRRQRLAHRRRRAHPRRRHGLARPAVRPGLRQRRLVTSRHRGRRGRAGEPTDEHPDLFWGLRGGGGNFGIVTEFEFRLHHIGTRALVAEFDLPASTGRPRRCARWRDLNADAPRQATFTASTAPRRHASPSGFVWVGDPAGPASCCPRCARSGAPSASASPSCPTSSCSPATTPAGGHALRRYSKGHYLGELPDDGDRGVPAARDPAGESHLPDVGLQAYGGAIADVPTTTTAFSHRDTLFEFGAGTRWTDPAEDDAADGGRPAPRRRAGAVRQRRLRQRAERRGRRRRAPRVPAARSWPG